MRVTNLAVIGLALAALLGTGLLAGCAGGAGGADLVQPVYRCTAVPTQPALARTAGASARYFNGIATDSPANPSAKTVGAECPNGVTLSAATEGATSTVKAEGDLRIYNYQPGGAAMGDVTVTVIPSSLECVVPSDWATAYDAVEAKLVELGLFTSEELQNVDAEDWPVPSRDDLDALLEITFNGSGQSALIPLILSGEASPASLCNLAFSATAPSTSVDDRLLAAATVLFLNFDLDVCANIGTATEETAWAEYPQSLPGFNTQFSYSEGNSNRWGWYHQLPEDGTYIFDLIAGQSADAGDVTVVRSGSRVTSIVYETDRGRALGAVQAYVGLTAPQSAPGRFPDQLKADPLPGHPTTYAFTGLSLEGQYFAAHADVWSVPAP